MTTFQINNPALFEIRGEHVGRIPVQCTLLLSSAMPAQRHNDQKDNYEATFHQPIIEVSVRKPSARKKKNTSFDPELWRTAHADFVEQESCNVLVNMHVAWG